MERLFWESFSFAPGVHTHHAWTEGGEIFARDMRNVIADENAYLRLRQSTGELEGAYPTDAVTGVFAGRDHVFYLQSDGTLAAVSGEGFEADTDGHSDLSGRLWVVDEFSDFVILKSEGAEKGYWTDFADTLDYASAEVDDDFAVSRSGDFAVSVGEYGIKNLGLEPPESAFSSQGFISNDNPLNTEIAGQNYGFVFRLAYARGYRRSIGTSRRGTPVPPVFDGMVSNLGPPVIYFNAESGDSELITVFMNNEEHEVRMYPLADNKNIRFEDFTYEDPQADEILLYQSEAVEPHLLRANNLDIDLLEYRLVGIAERDVDSTITLGDASRIVAQEGETTTWADQTLARMDNDRLPAEAAQITFYNDLVFAAVGEELRYSDIRDGGPVQWAWPKANSIIADGKVEVCIEHRGVLLFGGPRGLWRLTGTDEFNFDRDRVSSLGPVSSGAWGELVNGIGFIAEGGLYVTDGVGVQEVSSPILDAYFENTHAVDGAVAQLPDGSDLWAVKFDNGGRFQFLRSSRGGFFTWHGVNALQFAVKDAVMFADGTEEAVRTVEFSNDVDADLDWYWLSQEIDFKEQGYAEALKTFKWLEVSSSHSGEGHLQVIVDGISEDEVHDFSFRGGSQRPVRIPINRRGERIQFRVSGVGEVILRSMRLMAQVRSGRGRF